MAKGHPVDVDKLHEFFWRKADRFGVLTINQRKLASKMNIAHESLNRIMKRMEGQRRISKMVPKKYNVSSYLVVEPSSWKIRYNATKGD